MRKNIMKIIGMAVLALSVILVTTSGLVFAQDKSEDLAVEKNFKNNEGFGGNLDGTWDVVVTIRNCQTDAPIRSFPAVTTFMFGGTMIDSSGGIPPALRSPGQGVWSHGRGNTYSFSYKVFNFNANNVLTGWQIIEQHVNLFGSTYNSRGTSKIYDANGNLLSLGCSTTEGTRFE